VSRNRTYKWWSGGSHKIPTRKNEPSRRGREQTLRGGARVLERKLHKKKENTGQLAEQQISKGCHQGARRILNHHSRTQRHVGFRRRKRKGLRGRKKKKKNTWLGRGSQGDIREKHRYGRNCQRGPSGKTGGVTESGPTQRKYEKRKKKRRKRAR